MEGCGKTVRQIGKYKVEALIGEGGNADVYRAYDASSKRHVAIKSPRENPFRDNRSLKEFRREIQAMSALAGNPNVVSVYDVECDTQNSYIVMELVEGPSILDADLDDRQISNVIRDVANGLGCIHNEGLVHRDVKPGNILLSLGGVAKIADFGFAKCVRHANSRSEMYVVRGTPKYMSPEQAKGGILLDHRTDIYNLGLVFYELLTGESPFEGLNPEDSQVSIARSSRISPLMTEKKVNPSLARICEKCLMPDRDRRYQSCSEIIADLRKWRDKGTVTVSVPMSKVKKWSIYGTLISLFTIAIFLFGGWMFPREIEVIPVIPDGHTKVIVSTVVPGADLRAYPLRESDGTPILEGEVDLGKTPAERILKCDTFYLIVAERGGQWIETVRFVPSLPMTFSNENTFDFTREKNDTVRLETIKIVEPNLVDPIEFQGFLIERKPRQAVPEKYYTSLDRANDRGGIVGSADLLEEAIKKGLIEKSPELEWTSTITKVKYHPKLVMPVHKRLGGDPVEGIFSNPGSRYRAVRRLEPFGS